MLDTVNRLAVIVSKLDEVQDRLPAGEGIGLANAVRFVRRELASLREYQTPFRSDELIDLQAAITALRDVERMIRTMRRDDLKSELGEMLLRLVERTDDLHALSARLRERAVRSESNE